MPKMRGSKNNLLPRIGYMKVHKMSDYGIEIESLQEKISCRLKNIGCFLLFANPE